MIDGGVRLTPKVSVPRNIHADVTAAGKLGEAEMQAALNGHASATRSQAHFLDVTHPEANKGFVAGYFSRLLAMPEEEIATIGDGENDVLMFKRSGFSIAMGNASEEVRRQASVVTDSNDDEGFAKAVERFLLKTAD